MYQINNLDHLADVGISIEADSLEELFLAALKGMGSILKEGFCEEEHTPDFKADFKIQSNDLTVLLINFLSEALTISHTDSVIFCGLQKVLLNEGYFHASVEGNKVQTFDEDIKAVTFHEARVLKNEQGIWQTNLIFDI